MRVTLPRLHQGQKEVASAPARFKVLAAGRRFGKTRLGAAMCLETALSGKRAWWIGPSYKMAHVGWRGIRQLASQIPGAEIRQVDRIVTMPGGGWAQVRSADDPQSLRGEGLDFVVLDECAFMREAAWQEALRPSLADRKGRALFISTPKGRNFFWRLWQRGQEGGDEWVSFQFPTSANPYIDQGEIDAAQANLPERIFQQEFLASFLEDAGGIFRGVMAAATATEQDGAVEGHQYVFGVDWGKHLDYSCFVVLDLTDNTMAAIDRFNQIDYVVQTDRLKTLYERFRPGTVIVERNSIGEPLIERLQRDGLPVRPFTTTNASKAEAIDALALAFERRELVILNDPVLVGELQAYEAKRLPSGMLRYSAPEGMHDDTVMALALAWSGANVPPPAGSIIDDLDLDAVYKSRRTSRWRN